MYVKNTNYPKQGNTSVTNVKIKSNWLILVLDIFFKKNMQIFQGLKKMADKKKYANLRISSSNL